MVKYFVMLLLQGDHVALLSAFAEMGLKLRLDMPEQAMEVTTIFFRTSTTAKESLVSIQKALMSLQFLLLTLFLQLR
jgi:hypothetical protein